MFTVSDMVVELVTQKGESRFHFNGTVEWALDSVESDGVIWLPREDQLRELLAGTSCPSTPRPADSWSR